MSYFRWHYSTSLVSAWTLYVTGIRFIIEFFSIRDFIRTFFAPWKRMRDAVSSVFETQKFFEALVINTLMRLVGMFMKTCVLVFGTAVLISYLVAGGVLWLVWFLAPVALVALVLTAWAPLVHSTP